MTADRAEARPGGDRVLSAALLLATSLQAACISLPNAALLHIQGALSMADDQVGWVFSAYIAASAVTMPLAHWLAGRHGRKRVYQLSLAVLALGLVLATRAHTPMQFVAARIVQGAASGPLAPLSLAILLDQFPPGRHGRIGLVWTVTLVLGIVSGPSIGGWLAECLGWRSIFMLCLPPAGFISLALALSGPGRHAGPGPRLDLFGFAMLTLGMIGLQMLLDRGERLGWFASTEIRLEAAASALGFSLFAVHLLTTGAHFFDKALLKDRNFVISTILFFAFGFVLLPTMALTSPMLDELLGYPADTTGAVAIPRSVALVAALILASRLAPRVDNRLLIAAGTALVSYANWRMLGYSPAMHWHTVVAAGMVQGAGLGLLMPVLARTAFSTVAPALRADATILFNLARLYGSTIGIAVVQTYFYANTQAMHLALAAAITPYRATGHAAAHLASGPGLRELARLNELVTGQAAFVAVLGQFKILMIAMLVVSPLILFLRRQHPSPDLRGRSP